MENGVVASFDLSSEETPSYFKSSFARSMALNTSSGSKSLDYVYMDEGSTIREEPDVRRSPPRSARPRRSVPALPTYDPNFPRANRTNDALKFWKMKQQESVKTTSHENHHWLQNGDSLLQEESKEEEILRLRKECQSLMEANRKLQAGASNIDQSLLQSQIDTLQWQLKQAESNRQMYRAVMEQVSKFLERVHKALETSPAKSHPSRAKSRVSRSRSVHTVVSQSRGSSPSHSSSSSVHRANSISQIQDTSYTTFRDHAWRGSRCSPEEASPERLSQDAFRLLRTVQSLLATREPDLARVTESHSASMGSCSSLAHGSCKEEEKATTPQPSVGSTEDESGFSSMSSFHENGPSTSEGSHHELGLPLVEPHRHRRWSSTPADTGFREPLRVLWV